MYEMMITHTIIVPPSPQQKKEEAENRIARKRTSPEQQFNLLLSFPLPSD